MSVPQLVAQKVVLRHYKNEDFGFSKTNIDIVTNEAALA